MLANVLEFSEMPCKSMSHFQSINFVSSLPQCNFEMTVLGRKGCFLETMQNFISIAVSLLEIENENMLAGILQENIITQLELLIIFAASRKK